VEVVDEVDEGVASVGEGSANSRAANALTGTKSVPTITERERERPARDVFRFDWSLISCLDVDAFSGALPGGFCH
jgi:hypothetical protein